MVQKKPQRIKEVFFLGGCDDAFFASGYLKRLEKIEIENMDIQIDREAKTVTVERVGEEGLSPRESLEAYFARHKKCFQNGNTEAKEILSKV